MNKIKRIQLAMFVVLLFGWAILWATSPQAEVAALTVAACSIVAALAWLYARHRQFPLLLALPIGTLVASANLLLGRSTSLVAGIALIGCLLAAFALGTCAGRPHESK
ncbi:MAG: hypothetical protein KF863_01555 [Rubrivivax sp.]|nr:hypothetical protein [Rubrivivax sp.]